PVQVGDVVVTQERHGYVRPVEAPLRQFVERHEVLRDAALGREAADVLRKNGGISRGYGRSHAKASPSASVRLPQPRSPCQRWSGRSAAGGPSARVPKNVDGIGFAPSGTPYGIDSPNAWTP